MASNDELMDKMSEAASRVYDSIDSLSAALDDVKSAMDGPDFTAALKSANSIQEFFFRITGDLEGILDLEGQLSDEG